MSLEWARARLLEHREALRRRREPQATAATQSMPDAPTVAGVVPLRPAAAPRAGMPASAVASVIKFVPRTRRA